MLTKTKVISNAVALLGHKPIISLEEGDDMVVAAEQAYDMLLPSVLAKSNWRFAVQISQLSQLVETPPHPWQAIYSLPAGYIKTIRVYPQSYQWEIYESNKIYTQFTGDFWMEYVFEPVTSLLPGYFVNYFVYEIATYLALSNAEKPDFYSVLKAELVNQQAMAAAIDAQNRPSNSQVSFPVIDGRYSVGESGFGIS